MPDFRLPTPRKQSLVRFLDARLHDLDEAICKKNKPSEKFVPYASLEAIWTDARLDEFVQLIRPGFDRDLIPFVKGNLLRTLSILVYISWTDKEWELFGAIFLHRDEHGVRDRLDNRIPYYTLESLSQFLRPIHADRFNFERWTFYPIVLEEGRTQHFSKDWRLPFINPEPSIIGVGGYGQVTKEVIASRQFIACSVLPRALYQEEIPVARKRYANRADFLRETRNLEFLRRCLLSHRHIASYLCIIAVGNDYNLLSPLAEMDLDRFLRGGFETRFSQTPSLPLSHLITEARNVVGSLVFLHETLQTSHPGRACCHNDLKPANILVFDEPDTPVGTWKIADFGISIIAETGGQQSTVLGVAPDGTPTVHHPPARPASTYQAPEVCHGGEIGRKSDVWSLGCILVRILALGIDGLDGLKSLDAARGQPVVGEQDDRHDYFHRGSPPYLNPHIEQWLDGLPDRVQVSLPVDFMKESRALLRAMLAIPKPERPSARVVFDRLHRIERLAPHYTSTPAGTTFAPHTPSASHRSSTRSTPPTSSSMPWQLLPVRLLVGAIESGQVHELEAILHAGVNVEEEHEGERPLFYAIKAKNIAAVEKLREHAGTLEIGITDKDDKTPLMLAAAQGDPELVDLLLEMGAPVDGTSQTGLTPLMLAAREGHYKVVTTLLNQGADCQLYSPDGWSAFHYAVHGFGTHHLIKSFFGKVNVDIPTKGDLEPPLVMLSKMYEDSDRWWDKFDTLLCLGSDVNKTDVRGRSPLLIAIEDNRVKLARYLLTERGATLPPKYKRRSLSSDMQSVISQAKKMEKSTSERRDSTLSRASSHMSRFLSRSK